MIDPKDLPDDIYEFSAKMLVTAWVVDENRVLMHGQISELNDVRTYYQVLGRHLMGLAPNEDYKARMKRIIVDLL